MKKILLVAFLTLGMVLCANATPQNSNDVTGPVIPVEPNIQLDSRENVLVFMDNLPWGVSAPLDILAGYGVTVTQATHYEMATIDLSAYVVVYLLGQQPMAFYQEFTNQLSRFEDYLNAGGIIEFHTPTYSTYFFAGLTLPGGMTHAEDLDGNNYINDPTHPIVAGLVDPLVGNYASHEYYTNLPMGANTIIINESNLPTCVEYNIGAGTVVATGMPWEFNYAYGYSSGGCLPNAIEYTLMLGGVPVPIELSAFNANVVNDGVLLTWETASEIDCYEWAVQRNGVDIATLPGHGTTSEPQSYSYLDEVGSGTYTYQLKETDFSGAVTYSDEITVTVGAVVTEYALNASYPNPFNPSTTLSFTIPEAGNVIVSVYDVSGDLVATLADAWYEVGIHEAVFDGTGLASGVYLATLNAGDVQQTVKIVLMK